MKLRQTATVPKPVCGSTYLQVSQARRRRPHINDPQSGVWDDADVQLQFARQSMQSSSTTSEAATECMYVCTTSDGAESCKIYESIYLENIEKKKQ
jgi:hypothetical protein